MYLECNQGTYGKDCQHRCGSCINQTHCHYVNGTCFEGCGSGYLGDKCVDGNAESHVSILFNILRFKSDVIFQHKHVYAIKFFIGYCSIYFELCYTWFN